MIRKSSFWKSLGGKSQKSRRNLAPRHRPKSWVAGPLLSVESLEPRCMLSSNPVLSITPNQFFGQNAQPTVSDLSVPLHATFADVLVQSDVDNNTLPTYVASIDWGDGSPIDYSDVNSPNSSHNLPLVGVTANFPQTFANQLLGIRSAGDPIVGQVEAKHNFATTGQFNVTITLTDIGNGGTITESSLVNVYPTDPNIHVSGDEQAFEGTPYSLALDGSGGINQSITSWTVSWGDSVQTYSGNPPSVTHILGNDTDYLDVVDTQNGQHVPILAAVTGESGTYVIDAFPSVAINDVPATVTAEAVSTVVGEGQPFTITNMSYSDPGDPIQGWEVIWGDETASTTIDDIFHVGDLSSVSHVYANGDADYTVFALPIDVNNQAAGIFQFDVHVTKLASISGVVYVDVNHNGSFDGNEPGIDGVTIELMDQNGNPVLDGNGNAITAVTSNDGLYVFNGLEPGTYQVFEQQPTGVTDGAEHLGSLGGTIVANDVMQLTLASSDAFDYAFAEFGQQTRSGDAAGIGFWQNKNGQALIAQGGTQLADWLTSNFGNIFGDTLDGMSGSQVATFYRDQVFRGLKLGGPAKVDAQFMAVAMATFFTDATLAGQVATAYGFNVTDTGIGTNVVNVGTKGAAFNVADGSDLTIMQLLLATNSQTDQSNSNPGFAGVYDQDGDGVISSAERTLRTMANDVFSAINAAGGI